MEWTTTEGKTYDEAVTALLKSLGADRSEVEIEDLGEAKKLFGLGGSVHRVQGRLKTESFSAEYERPARRGETRREAAPRPVETPRPSRAAEKPREEHAEAGAAGLPDEVVEGARGFLESILRHMGVEDAVIKADNGNGTLALNIESGAGGLIIGKNGETLEALQTIMEIYASRLHTGRVSLVVDTEDYRQRREQKLREIAEKAAEKAATSGRQVFLGAMKSSERKMIHTFLQDSATVKTRSQGEGDRRQVVVFPAR